MMNRTIFYEYMRQIQVEGEPLLFPTLSQSQVDGTEMILNCVGEDGPLSFLAYELATPAHETRASMRAVRETWTPKDPPGAPSVDQAISRLNASFNAGDLPWVSKPYWLKDAEGKSWLGRGLVQLTHKTNYEKLGKHIGLDLVEDPERALQPSPSVQIMVQGMLNGLFTGKRLSDYLGMGDGFNDYYNARRIINGTESAGRVEQIARGFETALYEAGYGAEDPVPIFCPTCGQPIS